MNKKLFVLLIALMSLSLLGIVFVQGYWITNAYQTKEEQFAINARQILLDVAQEIQLREVKEYYDVYSKYVDSIEVPDDAVFTELAYKIKNNNSNETYIFTDGILEQDYKLSSGFDTDIDSIQFKKLTSRKTKTTITQGIDGIAKTDIRTESFSRLKDYERNQFEDFIRNISSMTPIYKRVSKEEIENLMVRELSERGLDIPFEYAVYSNNIETNVHSDNFVNDEESVYVVPLFVNEDLKTGFELYVSFSEKNKLVWNSILGMAILSLIFTSVIILAYASAISQIYKQRQISQIKTDFINNMTHEFKTPIATINLALDSLKNPKVKDNREFLDRYLGMIRDENKRMHAQVENVLRISKLEKNELDLPKERVNLQNVVEDSISHVSLIVEDRGGYIKTHYGALKSTVLANDSHLGNVIVNILDNAIKYSEDEPKIDIYSENVKNSIILKIRDQGMGMTKQVQKKIFEKFYREHTGDIHNVKGHGLGLAYVKRILDDHDAEIYVESEKGKGSTFILKLHLIS
ncbi:sensor histidine kinase [Aequorivita echinoideorum]|uniref:histidine kinase n=2 Tax=Aequorivita echinoideorum TaxID=1549647 RepID=A0ABS5S9R1_9FLAO|nr:HAMP domain-containing sensor histidine kinase [Aequorivita echinoideorum]MBT0608605.1 HAMP domain-containing histidine kinase [Aequorivita echinoideorum]